MYRGSHSCQRGDMQPVLGGAGEGEEEGEGLDSPWAEWAQLRPHRASQHGRNSKERRQLELL